MLISSELNMTVCVDVCLPGCGVCVGLHLSAVLSNRVHPARWLHTLMSGKSAGLFILYCNFCIHLYSLSEHIINSV